MDITEKDTDKNTMTQAQPTHEDERRPQNKMGYMPCNRLLISMSLPMMLSMLVQSLYNIVDSIFVAMLSEEALTAVSLAFSVQSLIIAISAGTGVGINARLSAKLGERNFKEVNITAGNGLFLGVVYGVFFLITAQIAMPLFFNVMTDDPVIRQYGTDYMLVIMSCAAAVIFQMLFERLLQSTGKTIFSMISQATGAVINIILDPIMIFGLCGFPAMGTRGAALATVIGQLVAATIGYCCNRFINKEIQLGFRFMKPNARVIRQIYSVGIPSIIMQSIGSVMTVCLNAVLLTFSATAVAVFGVYFKLQSFVFMPVFGLNNGVVPIIAFNYGACKPDRIKETFKYAAIYATLIMFVGLALFEICPGVLLDFFSASDNMKEIGIPALRIIATSFVLPGFAIVCSSVFQALGHGMLSLWTSLIRQLVILVPCAFILSRFMGATGVWLAFPIAEVFSGALSYVFIKHIMRSEVDVLYD